jgi:hypothetical protein
MDTEALTCGWCHKPLDPNGPSLFFCPPQNRSSESNCQREWGFRQVTEDMFNPARWEEFTGATTATATAAGGKPVVRPKVA